MEALTPEEDLVLTRLIEELKRYPRLRRALIEAMELTELLSVPEQLEALRQTVEQVLLRQAEQGQTLEEHGKRLERVEKLAEEAKNEAQAAKQEAQEAKKVALEVRERVNRIERDVAHLKGRSEELHAAKRMPSLLGKYLRKLHIYDPQQFGRLAEEQFELSEDDYTELLNADWFASGRLRGSEREVWLVIEVSWGVGLSDVERAHQRASILQRAGAEAFGMAMGQGAAPEAVQRAQQLGVLLALDGTLHNAQLLRHTEAV